MADFILRPMYWSSFNEKGRHRARPKLEMDDYTEDQWAGSDDLVGAKREAEVWSVERDKPVAVLAKEGVFDRQVAVVGKGRGYPDWARKEQANPRRHLPTDLMSEHIPMPGFPQLIVTRAFAYQWMLRHGSSEREAQYFALNKPATAEPLTPVEIRQRRKMLSEEEEKRHKQRVGEIKKKYKRLPRTYYAEAD